MCVFRGKLYGGKLNRVIDKKNWGLSLRRALDEGSRRQSSMEVGSGLGDGNGWTEIASTKSMDGVGDGGVGLPEPCYGAPVFLIALSRAVNDLPGASNQSTGSMAWREAMEHQFFFHCTIIRRTCSASSCMEQGHGQPGMFIAPS